MLFSISKTLIVVLTAAAGYILYPQLANETSARAASKTVTPTEKSDPATPVKILSAQSPPSINEVKTKDLTPLLQKSGYAEIPRQARHPLGGMSTTREEKANYPFNLGPTGILAVRDAKSLTYTVSSILPDSPASGKIKPGDVIIGIGQNTFKEIPAPQDARQRYPNPQMGLAIEAAESSENAELTLLLTDGSSTKNISLQLRPLGAYGRDFPRQSPKADYLATLNTRIIASRQLPDGMWKDGFKGNKSNKGKLLPTCMAALALMSSGDPQYDPQVKKAFEAVLLDKPRSFQSWQFCYKTIFLTEYHLRYGDDRAIPQIKDMVDQLAAGAFYYNGVYGYGHSLNRGNYRYGGINACTAHAALVFGLAKKLSIPIPNKMDLKMAQSIERLAPDGALDYGWTARSKGPITSVKHNENAGRTGVALMAYRLLGGRDKHLRKMKDYMLLNKEYTDCGHSSGGSMSWVWASIGMSYDSPEHFQKLMRSRIWYLNFNRLPQGDFYLQPSAHLQFRPSDVVLGPNYTTSGNIIILNATKQNLLITGKPSFKTPTDTAYQNQILAASDYFERQDRLVEIAEALGLLQKKSPQSLIRLMEALKQLPLEDPDYQTKLSAIYHKHLEPAVRDIANMSLDTKTRHAAIAAVLGINYSPRIRGNEKSLRITHTLTPPNIGTATLTCNIPNTKNFTKTTSPASDRSTQKFTQRHKITSDQNLSATTAITWRDFQMDFKFPLEDSVPLRDKWSPSQTDTTYGPFYATVEKAQTNGTFQARLAGDILFECSLMGSAIIHQNGKSTSYANWIKSNKTQIPRNTLVRFTYYNRGGNPLLPMIDTIQIIEKSD